MNQKQIRKNCTQFLTGHYRQTPHQILTQLATATTPQTKADMYGTGDLIDKFTREMCELLGKPACIFMPSGTMAQQIALRIWSQRHNNPNIAFHPKSHLEIHEHKAYQFLHNLRGIHVGKANEMMTFDDIQQINQPIAALLIELPQREIGGQLPCWDELKSIHNWAKQHNIALHLDGARIWECKPFYQREYSEICSLFDTVYASFYKGLGGITGAILAGPKDVIDEAHIWQRRHGGDLLHLYPYILSAQQSLQQRLPKMASYHQKAIAIAQIFNSIQGIEIKINPGSKNPVLVSP